MSVIAEALAIAGSAFFDRKRTEIIDLTETSGLGIREDKLPRSETSKIKKREVENTILQNKNLVVVSPTFKLVFITVVVITVGCGMLEVVLAATWYTTTTNQQSVFEAVGFAWKAGIGAIFGLLGGKIR